jgi:predicted dehydrogenase
VTSDLNVGIVGLGYWGPNLLRNALEIETMRVCAICDRDPDVLARYARRNPDVRATPDINSLLSDDKLDAVVLATPISTHYELARRCLEAGKHVLVEKPMAETVAHCEALIELAAKRNLVLMPGLTYVYSPAVVAIKRMIELNEIGDLYFGTFSRVNLGIHRSDISVVRDLAPHDYSILLYWLGYPNQIRAVGRSSIVPGVLDVAFIDAMYDSGLLVHAEMSWLAPTKIRRIVLVGSSKMVVYDDTSLEQVRVFDRGVDVIEPKDFGEFQLAYRSGDILSPRLEPDEPLGIELLDFADSIREGREPRATTTMGLEVVQLIEATELSLANDGAPVSLSRVDAPSLAPAIPPSNIVDIRRRVSGDR